MKRRGFFGTLLGASATIALGVKPSQVAGEINEPLDCSTPEPTMSGYQLLQIKAQSGVPDEYDRAQPIIADLTVAMGLEVNSFRWWMGDLIAYTNKGDFVWRNDAWTKKLDEMNAVPSFPPSSWDYSGLVMHPDQIAKLDAMGMLPPDTIPSTNARILDEGKPPTRRSAIYSDSYDPTPWTTDLKASKRPTAKPLTKAEFKEVVRLLKANNGYDSATKAVDIYAPHQNVMDTDDA